MLQGVQRLAMAPPETAHKSMKPESNPEAAETVQTTDSPAVVHERLVRHLFAEKVVYLYSVKLLRQSRVNPNEQDRHEEFYAAQDIRDVWAGIALELADEAVEVESVTRCVPILSFLLPNKPIAKGSAIGFNKALGARHANGKCCPLKPDDVAAASAARPAARNRYEPDATDTAYEDDCARRCGF